MKYWKAYTCLYGCLLAYLIVVSAIEGSIVILIAATIYGGLTFSALIGIISRKAILWLWVWKALLALHVISLIQGFYFTYLTVTQSEINDLLILFPIEIISYIFIAPAIFGTYWYAYRDKILWQKAI